MMDEENKREKTPQKKQQIRMDMTVGSLAGKILIFAIPIMLSSALQLLFNAVDTVVVGRYCGKEALAAVGSNGSMINLIINLFIGLSLGTNVVVARYIGAKKYDDASRAVHTAIVLSLVGGVALAVFGFFMGHTILRWMGSPEDVIDLATLYLKIFFIGMPANLFYNFGSAILRAMGDTKRPLYYLTFAGVMNATLNIVFIVAFSMGVAGVALATIISQGVSAALVLRCLMKEEGPCHVELSKLILDRRQAVEILRCGIPAGIQGMLFAFSNVLIQSAVNSFGSVVMAGNAAAMNVEGFVYTGMNSYYQTAISFTSQNYGAGKLDRIPTVLKYCELYAILVGTILGNLAYFFGAQLIGIYSSDPAVIQAGIVRLGYICRVYALCGMMDVMVGVIRGLGYSLLPTIVSFIGACLFRVFWLQLIFPLFRTPGIIYISYAISWILTFLAHLCCYVVITRRIRGRKLQERVEEL